MHTVSPIHFFPYSQMSSGMISESVNECNWLYNNESSQVVQHTFENLVQTNCTMNSHDIPIRGSYCDIPSQANHFLTGNINRIW
ncbi:hypothetical protein LOAG_17444 [Loa loa]|uniref:Uncharacterized protein n=1 Tax=Loa loa TaxID=7209 RepID=A0A1S0UJ55_LOALO|nr:hypothetical protein LOAG_17444 [Loa loa]EJD75398.1 hypothetical protein LOAG_17444 [Loa loa]